MAEISAFRYLNKRNDDIEYVIMTTKLINGNNFVENLYGKNQSTLNVRIRWKYGKENLQTSKINKINYL
jgi:hypothetical protein